MVYLKQGRGVAPATIAGATGGGRGNGQAAAMMADTSACKQSCTEGRIRLMAVVTCIAPYGLLEAGKGSGSSNNSRCNRRRPRQWAGSCYDG